MIRTQGLRDLLMLKSPKKIIPWAHEDAMIHYKHMNLGDIDL